MDLPDESQWDETTCDMAVCQHPQCWATIRRIERGHPRILGSGCKAPPDADGKLPVVTIVNISDSCFWAKRRPHRHLPRFTFTKPHSSLSQRSKFDSKFQGRPQKKLPGKDLINYTDRSFKLPVVNLNETPLPCPQDVGNMAVVWIPKEPEDRVGHQQLVKKFLVKHMNLWSQPKGPVTVHSGPKQPARRACIQAERYQDRLAKAQSLANIDNFWINPAAKHIVPGRGGRKKRKTPTVKDKSSLVLSGKQDLRAQLRAPGIIVPPPSPVHFFEQLNSEFPPLWNQSDTLPRYLLNDLLSDEEKTSPSLEMTTQLAMMKKKPPLENSRPDSAISAKIFLSAHRLTLQTPALRYPEHLKRLYHNLKEENRFSGAARFPGNRKPQWPQERQRQRTSETPTEKQFQEAEENPKSDPGSHSTPHKRLGALVGDPCYGHRTVPGQESDKRQQMKEGGPTVPQDSTERPQTDRAENCLDSSRSEQDPALSGTDSTDEDISTEIEVEPEEQKRTPKDPSARTSRLSWNPELKLLRILQASDDEDEENQLSGAQRGESPEAEAEAVDEQPCEQQGA